MRQVKHTFVGVWLLIFISSGFMGLYAAETKIMTKNLYQKISLSSSKGKINLFAPDKCIAGDTISGKMKAEPSGKIPGDYSVEIAGVKTGVRNGWATWTVPEAKDFTVTLLNKKGKRVDRFRMPVYDKTSEMKPRDFQCPEIIQVGHAFPIPGQYNGVFDDTIVRVGEEEVEKLVESPRAVIVEPPPQQTGEIEISVKEGNVTKTFRTRNISVLLHADDLHLKRGQTTAFTVTVKGLEELEERLPLYVTNHSRETVNLEGEGKVWIEPSAVNPEDGSFVFESSISAHSSGSFRITATVIDQFAFAPAIVPPGHDEFVRKMMEEFKRKKEKEKEKLWEEIKKLKKKKDELKRKKEELKKKIEEAKKKMEDIEKKYMEGEMETVEMENEIGKVVKEKLALEKDLKTTDEEFKKHIEILTKKLQELMQGK